VKKFSCAPRARTSPGEIIGAAPAFIREEPSVRHQVIVDINQTLAARAGQGTYRPEAGCFNLAARGVTVADDFAGLAPGGCVVYPSRAG